MKEYSLICAAADIRAIQAGTMTEDRHVIVPQPAHWTRDEHWRLWPAIAVRVKGQLVTGAICCPLGVPGDRLWCKEALHKVRLAGVDSYWAAYSAGRTDGGEALAFSGPDCCIEWRWKRSVLPAVSMPLSACRLVLEITDVRVELGAKVWNWVRTFEVMK